MQVRKEGESEKWEWLWIGKARKLQDPRLWLLKNRRILEKAKFQVNANKVIFYANKF